MRNGCNGTLFAATATGVGVGVATAEAFGVADGAAATWPDVVFPAGVTTAFGVTSATLALVAEVAVADGSAPTRLGCALALTCAETVSGLAMAR